MRTNDVDTYETKKLTSEEFFRIVFPKRYIKEILFWNFYIQEVLIFYWMVYLFFKYSMPVNLKFEDENTQEEGKKSRSFTLKSVSLLNISFYIDLDTSKISSIMDYLYTKMPYLSHLSLKPEQIEKYSKSSLVYPN